ncbi:MAG: hypothetical protein H6707_09150 [Deltaproteobacteria bacterium]|nr:hypothetical protein [Deltaproteobacteria bacterium]
MLPRKKPALSLRKPPTPETSPQTAARIASFVERGEDHAATDTLGVSLPAELVERVRQICQIEQRQFDEAIIEAVEAWAALEPAAPSSW